MIALDTNILVYARREETPFHRQAYKLLKELASGESPWALPSLHPPHLSRTVRAGHASGNLLHDAHIAALAIEHGVQEFWTIDRDFTRFPDLRIRNPFVE